MTFANFSAHVVNPVAAGPAPAVAAAAASTDGEGGMSFGDLLDIVNPLQHIPVVSTLYRAITGDQIKTFPKIAGDLLYGGVTGFISSIADTVFQKITGKSFGDTALAFVEKEFSPSAPDTAVASAAAPSPAPAPPPTAVALQTPATRPPTVLTPPPSTAVALQTPTPPAAIAPASLDSIVVPGQDALLLALTRNGVGQDVALRAADAYRRTLNGASAGTLH